MYAAYSSRKKGYRTPGKILLIGVTRSEKIRRKRFAMLTSEQRVSLITYIATCKSMQHELIVCIHRETTNVLVLGLARKLCQK